MKKKIKKIILKVLLYLFKWHLMIIYFFIKLFTKQKEEVFFLSRQSDVIPEYYNDLMKELDKSNISYKVICKRVPSSVNTMLRNEKRKGSFFVQLSNILSYYFNLYKQLTYIATSKVVVIDGYNLVVSLFNHKKSTTIIQIWHALGAIKKFGYQTLGKKNGINKTIAKILKMHRNYDYIISTSKEMSKCYSEAFNTPENKILPIGTPTVDNLLKPDKMKLKSMFKDYPILKTKPNILYVPTFRSDGTDNNEEIIKNFDTEKYNLIFQLHPKSDPVDPNSGVITVDRKKYSTTDLMKMADYIITDYSSLIFDACILDKKLLLYLYDYDKYSRENGLNVDLFKELKGCAFKDIKDIINIIDNNSYDKKSYNKFKKKYTNNFKGNSTKELVKLIKENL